MPKKQGRIYMMTKEDAHAFNTVVSSTLLVYYAFACVLFDFGDIHLFVSSAFIQKHAMLVSY